MTKRQQMRYQIRQQRQLIEEPKNYLIGNTIPEFDQLIENNVCDYVPELDKFIKLNELNLEMNMLNLTKYKEVYICSNKPFHMMIGAIVYTFHNNKYYFPHTLKYHEMRLYITDDNNIPDVYVCDVDREINEKFNVDNLVYKNVSLMKSSNDNETHYLYTDRYRAFLCNKNNIVISRYL